jgi:hypothetical protein
MQKILTALLTLSVTIHAFAATENKVVLPVPNYPGFASTYVAQPKGQILASYKGLSEHALNTYTDNEPIDIHNGFTDYTIKAQPLEQLLLDYDLNEHIQIESEYAYFPTSQFDHTGTNVSDHAVDVLGIVSTPISEELSIRAKAGVSYLNNNSLNASDPNSANFGPAFGLEALYRANPDLYFNLSWMHYGDDDTFLTNDQLSRADILSLGLSYQLDNKKRS